MQCASEHRHARPTRTAPMRVVGHRAALNSLRRERAVKEPTQICRGYTDEHWKRLRPKLDFDPPTPTLGMKPSRSSSAAFASGF